MSKMGISIFVVIAIVSTITFIYFALWLSSAINNPNATLAVKGHEGTSVMFGHGYAAIIKDNGELWIWGIGGDPSANDGYERSPQVAWKLADQVAAVVPIGMHMDYSKEAYLCVLKKNASLWIWYISARVEKTMEIIPLTLF